MSDEDWDAGDEFLMQGVLSYIQHSEDDGKRGRKAIIVKTHAINLRAGVLSSKEREGETVRL